MRCGIAFVFVIELTAYAAVAVLGNNTNQSVKGQEFGNYSRKYNIKLR